MIRNVALFAMVAVAFCAVVHADPPGPLDGKNIPSNFGELNKVAVQRNHTGFGDYEVIPGALLPGSELDGVFVAKTSTKLHIGLTGNLEENGHAYMIGIGIPGVTGQTELRAEGEDAPPGTLQDAGREVIVNDNDTPEDPTDDTWSYGENGTILPVETKYVIAVDVFGGTASISEYELLDPSGEPDDYTDPTPDNPDDPDQPIYTIRTFVTQGPVGDGNDVWENDQSLGYETGGFDNSNLAGVTDTDGSSASTATTGLELAIPFSRLGITGNTSIYLWVAMLDGGGGDGNGIVTNQVLPPLDMGEPCNPPAAIGKRVDLSSYMDFYTVILPLVDTFSGTAEGVIDPAEYDGGMALDYQTCPTPYGDQVPDPDPDAITRNPGSELDALYMTDDGVFLYLGITGNLQENGNRLHIWVDSVEGGKHILDWDGMGDGGSGMEGDAMPPLMSDPGIDPLFDYAFSINVGGELPNANVWVDFWDLEMQASSYLGRAIMESDSGEVSEGSNQWNTQVALNNLNSMGVLGTGFQEPVDIWDDTSAEVEAMAETAQSGFEIAIPLAQIGLNPCDGPHDIHVWMNITGSDGWRSCHSLPSMRGDGEPMIWNPENNAVDWYVPGFPVSWQRFMALAASHTVTYAGPLNDCDGNGIDDMCDILDGTFEDVDMDGTPDVCQVSGDLNVDGVIDLADFLLWEACMTGPEGGLLEGCDNADFDKDGDVDMFDKGGFSDVFTG
jgi:hypothetical protein